MATLEDLLRGRSLLDLTDEEIEELVKELKPSDIGKVRKALTKNRRTSGAKKEKAADLVDALIAKGLSDADS